jgi:1-pyrroline-5-carboxylate dehydrogenase
MQWRIPKPLNEPILEYAPGSPERDLLIKEMERIVSSAADIPLVIGGERIFTEEKGRCVLPHDHRRSVGEYSKAGAAEAEMAVSAALAAREDWAAMPWENRAAVFLKAAMLLSNEYRHIANATVMLVHSKNPYQSEIDVAELIDFWRFNSYFAQEIYDEQPVYSSDGTWNRLEYRALEGFVFAVTPFNFFSIDGNLPTAPAIAGNTVVWKPASSVVYSNYLIYRILEEAGLPPGVINFLPGDPKDISGPVLSHPEIAGVHFTGSTPTFSSIYSTLGCNIEHYRNYPRLVGETGGKGFIVAHPSADPKAVEVSLLRGAFEYQGQKCSSSSRAYVPRTMWPSILSELKKDLSALRTGPPLDPGNFFNAVIDKGAYERIVGYIEMAKDSDALRIVHGGEHDDSKGYYISPTIIETTDPEHRIMKEEIFGPILSVYVYDDERFEDVLSLCDRTSPYALTGAIFGNDREAILLSERKLMYAAGNFYINDKPTGAVVGQQPFGGARSSGTNDKAGSKMNMMRWISARTIKENLDPPRDHRYPFMDR